MTILQSDIKLMKSERLTDYDDGGGQITGNAVIDGELNNLFPDISSLDRVYGRVSLRKGYVSVDTANTDMYYGAHCIVTDPPADDNVSVTLFSTANWTDDRADARDRVESYLALGGESRFVLLGNHLAGQRAIQVYCRLEVPTLEVGEVYILSQEKTGYPEVSQYVRVTRVVSRVTTEFVAGSECGTFTRDVITFEISNPLRYDFAAANVTCMTSHGSPTLFRTSVVADAAQYAGVAKLAADVTSGALNFTVPDIFSQLVPSTQVETPVLDALAGMQKPSMVQSGVAGSLSVSNYFSASANTPVNLFFGSPVCRGSVSISSPVSLTDDGQGNIIAASGDASGYSGTVVYETGALTISRTSSWAATLSASATPAGLVTDTGHTLKTAITIQNRQYNYTANLQPIPAPGTLTVDYRTQGKWVRLTDDGLGKLFGRDGEGTGTVNYATGSALLTVGALPDAGSAIIWSWGSGVHYERRDTDSDIRPVAIPIVTTMGVVKGSLTISYLAAGVTKTVTDDGAGNLTGHGSGVIDYTLGNVSFYPSLLPDAGSNTDISYSHAQTNNVAGGELQTGTKDINGVVAFTLVNSAVVAGTVDISTSGFVAGDSGTTLIIFRDLTGLGVLAQVRLYDNFVIRANAGTIDYTTGNVSITPEHQVSRTEWNATTQTWETALKTMQWSDNSPIYVNYLYGVVTTTPAAASIPVPAELQIDLTPINSYTVAPGSVRMTLFGDTCIDRSGSLVKNVSATTNSGTAIGSVNYSSGLVTVTSWTNGAPNTLTLQSLLVRYGQWNALATTFRTPGSPLRPGSLYVRALRASDSVMLSATSDMNGNLVATGITGTVDAETGVVDIAWGAPMLPDTIYFNCVLYTSMPLDADLLGLDPVRLPIDGRVPIFKTGNVVVVHDTASFTMPSPLTAGQVVALPRGALAYAVLSDANGVLIPTALYSVNLTTGSITMANPLDLSAYAQPLACEHRIEDMALVTDVQITGEIAVAAQLTHAYTAANSYVSSALVIGDLQARFTNLFEQATWTSVWSDLLIGSATTAQYNDVLYPVLVANRGCIQERWAIIFTGSTTFNVVGEYSGIVATGTTSTNCAPINPITGTPYFTLDYRGWGTGWAANNVVRFNTIAANYPVWVARTTTMGEVTAPNDNFRLQIRGDAD